MFTLEQLKQAHSKVKSGADFPAYIKKINELGVTHYTTYVADGHTEFFGVTNHSLETPVKYDVLTIGENSNSNQFIIDLKLHQQGKTDFLTFCSDCAQSGIEKWSVSMLKMSCSYFDTAGNEVLVEQMPQ